MPAPETALPIVDISPFLDPVASEEDKLASAKTLYDACTSHGFFYLVGHGVPYELMVHVLQMAKNWFLTATDQEKEELVRKDAGVGEGDGARGYQRIGENVTQGKSDFHEAIDLYRPWPSPTSPPYKLLQGTNLLPHSPPFRDRLDEYIKTVLTLGSHLMRCMALSLSLPESYFEPYTNKSFWVARIIGYPPLPQSHLSGLHNPDAGISCGEHTDYGCWTLLLTDETPNALKVQSADGTWISADPIKGAYVVNIGDMGAQWTNGLFKSTVHKVIHRGRDYRVSLPVFFEPNFDAVIKPLEGCVQKTGGLAKFGEKLYGEHLVEKIGGNFGAGGGRY